MAAKTGLSTCGPSHNATQEDDDEERPMRAKIRITLARITAHVKNLVSPRLAKS